MSSTELVRSAAEVGDQFLAKALRDIDRAVVEKKIADHYFGRAEKLYKKVWRACKRNTGHSKVRTPYEYEHYVCSHCGHPSGQNVPSRRRSGISTLAEKLRAADRAAGIEWTP